MEGLSSNAVMKEKKLTKMEQILQFNEELLNQISAANDRLEHALVRQRGHRPHDPQGLNENVKTMLELPVIDRMEDSWYRVRMEMEQIHVKIQELEEYL